eukprot:417325-Prymnesium_polylepis.1
MCPVERSVDCARSGLCAVCALSESVDAVCLRASALGWLGSPVRRGDGALGRFGPAAATAHTAWEATVGRTSSTTCLGRGAQSRRAARIGGQFSLFSMAKCPRPRPIAWPCSGAAAVGELAR